MNGSGPPPAQQGLWQTAKNAEGRTYYWHLHTKQTTYERPVELIGPAEVSALMFILRKKNS